MLDASERSPNLLTPLYAILRSQLSSSHFGEFLVRFCLERCAHSIHVGRVRVTPERLWLLCARSCASSIPEMWQFRLYLASVDKFPCVTLIVPA